MDDLTQRQAEMKLRLEMQRRRNDPELQKKSRIKNELAKGTIKRRKEDLRRFLGIIQSKSSDAAKCLADLEYIAISPAFMRNRGVYAYVNRGAPVYVGMTLAGLSRCAEHTIGPNAPIIRNSTLYFFRVPDSLDIQSIESYMIYHLRPCLNRTDPQAWVERIADEARFLAARICLFLRPSSSTHFDE